MSQIRYPVRIGLGGWLAFGLWGWILPLAAFWVWTGLQTRLGWTRATVESVAALAAITAARFVGLSLYHRLLANRWPVTVVWDGAQIVSLPTDKNFPFLASVALPFGLVMGVVANLMGWSAVIPDRWFWLLLGAPLASLAFVAGSLFLYNRVASPWLGAIQVTADQGDGRMRAIAFQAASVRRATHLIVFLWVGAVTVVIALLGGSLLTVLARHIPAGIFGLEAGGFAVAVALFLGFWGSALLGIWYAAGARVYRIWQNGGGGIWWQEAGSHEAS
ncbi:hypothetical protein [Sulfobacillus harzensis]|uniref:Uncharacterized protein n=1 Tax=Sulfobacillus harzensis TaxID=2729629 RepID=A0A7Y0L388_9FIRM|nr:hypothetical protein [Sulfobacillus harzensis]NMP22478.1 hypothetical protein [Sulfobacillus harzensis]